MSDSLTALERRVLATLDEDAVVETLVDLVRIPSVGGSDAELEVQEHVAELLRSLDTDVDRWDLDLDELRADPWFPGEEVERAAAIGVVGTTAGEGSPALVLCGHADVVPPGDVETWQGTDPFSAEIREGAVYGRGACDMKGGVAANLSVLRTLRDAGVRLERPLAVHSVVGEEDGGLGAFATLRRGHRGDAAVLTEPTGAQLITATAGALTFRIEVTGRSAHGSMRKEGVSALEAFLPVYTALVDLETARNADVDRRFVGEVPYALSFGIVHAGEWSSSVPDKLVAEGRFGVQIGEDPRAARTAFEDVVAEVALKDPWLHDNRPLVTWPGGQFASGWLDDGHPLVGEMAGAVTALGRPAPVEAAGVYGSDMRLYTAVGGVPTLHYGPGDFRLAHAPLERVEVDELLDVTRALLVLALRRCGAVD